MFENGRVPPYFGLISELISSIIGQTAKLVQDTNPPIRHCLQSNQKHQYIRFNVYVQISLQFLAIISSPLYTDTAIGYLFSIYKRIQVKNFYRCYEDISLFLGYQLRYAYFRWS